MNIFSPHIQFNELVDLAEERSVTAAEAGEHLASCSECSDQLHSIKQTIGLMKSDATEDAPPASIAYARNIFRDRVGTPQPTILTRLMAALTFDSLTMAPAFGLRSHTTAGRQLIYSTETADIDVRVSNENEQWLITGQLLGAECASGAADLEGETFSASAKLSELCEFSFGSVPPGAYKISVRLPGLSIETPPIELGP